MKRKLIVRPDAADDIDEAHDYYERKRYGLGEDFVACIEAMLEQIAARPLSFTATYRDIRRAVVRRFPYGIFFRILDDVIYVVGVFHGRRSPRQIRRRAE